MTTEAQRSAPQASTIIDVLSAAGPRPERPSSLSTSLSFGWRALLKIKHVPEQLFDVTAFPIMFTLLFTYLFGGALAGSTDAYIQFLLPGILVQTVVMITMYTGVTMNKDIEKGVFDRFRSLPIWRPSPLVGALLGDVVRYTLASVIVLILGLILGFRPQGGLLGVIASIVLLLVFSFCLSWIWTMIAMIVRTEAAVMGMSMFILFPLTFASNIFVDPNTMPGWLRAFVDVNPVSFLVTSLRGLMQGDVDTGQLGVTLVLSAAMLAIFGPITMRLYSRKS
ncbi:ABC transporter permease [Rhodococcoides fascians]|jgi:ABC-2 type transport system permease protein|uniref:Transport permease protein n=1 Tax=Rhodococcoides fascians TaxID=1828 RepID=A0A143QPJ2_RHOFA|nr:ABC transporter permease [Rhodococcus fascians]AMY25093.1 Daunorubicin/doxorubicin resistance ABC transporter permease protein DrrB [Rhodococcus fascians]OZC40138.1 ABC transporter permease [Rhodococcus fascians]